MEYALDVIYISTRKNRRFAKLPELNLGDAAFKRRRFDSLLKAQKLPPQILTAIENKASAIL